MSHKLAFQKAPQQNLDTWKHLQQIVVVTTVGTIVVLLGLFFAFIF